MKIREVKQNKKDYLALLLLADEQESMIDRYIDRGTMYVLEDGGVKCECIVTDEGNGILEIKNIATEPEFQRNGYAKKMVEYIAEKHKGKYSVLQVGTGDSPLTVPFYEKCGFVKTHSIKNFFIDNYDHPFYECGVSLKDMIYLQRAISGNGGIKVDRTYLCIDLKSFYASVECVTRRLDPLTTNLVVADVGRTEKTICLAVTPSLKSYGIPGRARLFEVIQKVEQINRQRKYNAPHHKLDCESYNAVELERNPSLALSYIAAPPRMAYYMEYSTRIYNIYLKYIAPEDIHVYSIDEVFIDLTHYLSTYKCTARELAQTMIKDVLANTGITATAGIGTNMYLAKIAMDITAKKMPADENGVRIAELDEMSYRKELWTHKPLTDFWMLGSGIAKKLEANYMYTMGDVACCSHYDEAKLFKLFGVNAELIIDRAWGWEPTTIADIKAYKPSSNSLSVGQVLKCPYNCEKTKLIVREMIDQHVLDLVDKGLVTDQIVLDIGYDIENLTDPKISAKYHGDVTTDRYGRKVPKHAHGTANLEKKTSSSHIITEATINLFDRIINKDLLVRRITVATCKLVRESDVKNEPAAEQISLFDDPVEKEKREQAERQALEQEKQMQKTIIGIKKRFGKNAILKGMNFQEGATARERNEQVGGHKA